MSSGNNVPALSDFCGTNWSFNQISNQCSYPALSQAHSFNGAPVHTIGQDVFTIKLADRIIDLLTFLVPPSEQLSFPLIVSGGYLRDALHISTFEHYKEPCYLYDADTQLPLPQLNKIDGYLTIPINPKTLLNTISLTTTTPCEDLHMICSHFNKRKIQKLLTNSAPGRTISIPPTRLHSLPRTLKAHPNCPGCRQSKVTKKVTKAPFVTKASRPLELLRARTLYLGKANFLVIIDHFTSYLWIYQVESKAEIPGNLYHFFRRLAQRFPGYPVSSFMTDNGTEFINQKLAKYLTDLTIKHNEIPTYVGLGFGTKHPC